MQKPYPPKHLYGASGRAAPDHMLQEIVKAQEQWAKRSKQGQPETSAAQSKDTASASAKQRKALEKALGVANEVSSTDSDRE